MKYSHEILSGRMRDAIDGAIREATATLPTQTLTERELRDLLISFRALEALNAELLAALKNTLSALGARLPSGTESMHPVFQEAMAAIAKAEQEK